MSRNSRIPTLLTAAVLLSSATALAATNYKLSGDAHTTKVSGKRGDGERRLAPAAGADHQGLFQVTLWSPSEGVCKVQMKSRDLNTYVTRQAKWEEAGVMGWDGCANNAKNKHTVAFTGSETYVRGINVCMRKGIIAGVRLHGSRLNRGTGKLSKLSTAKDWKHRECTNWMTPQYCPAGKIATAVTLTTDDPGWMAVDQPVGFKLECRDVVLQ